MALSINIQFPKGELYAHIDKRETDRQTETNKERQRNILSHTPPYTYVQTSTHIYTNTHAHTGTHPHTQILTVFYPPTMTLLPPDKSEASLRDSLSKVNVQFESLV